MIPAHHRLREYFPYTYNLFRAYNRDYYDLRDQLVNRYIGKPELLKYADFINNNIPPFESGKYRVISDLSSLTDRPEAAGCLNMNIHFKK